MTSINRLLLVGLLSVGISAATTAQAGNQLFTAEWFTKSFGNERINGTGQEAVYSVFAIPQGQLCNYLNPRCPFDSTPTDGLKTGRFFPLGGTFEQGAPPFNCTPWNNPELFPGGGGSERPAKGETVFQITPAGGNGLPIPPQYRNPLFFTSDGEPKRTKCLQTSVDVYTRNGVPNIPPDVGTPDELFTAGGLTKYEEHYKGLVQVGHPVAGTWNAVTTGIPGKGGFGFLAAPNDPAGLAFAGVRTTGLVGEFSALYPYLYSYTYATLRNDVGIFGPGSGPGSFNIKIYEGVATVASINVKEREGAAKFGGVMRMLGAYTNKVCYFTLGGCSIGRANWRYDAVGASAYYSTPAPGVYVITKGYQALSTFVYYHTALMQKSTINVVGSHFPWTTGSATLMATGGGERRTIHYAQGYDNRTTTMMGGVTNVGGTIQFVAPLLTHWTTPAAAFSGETGGVAILKIKFVPEPKMWAMLVAGISLLGVATRMRGR